MAPTAVERLAGAVLAAEAIALLAVVGWEIVALVGGDTIDVPSSVALIVLTAIGAVALAAACETLASLPAGTLEAHEAYLRERLVSGLESIPGVQVVRAWADAPDPVGVVTFSVVGHDPGLVAAYLSAEHGIGVRDGRFCAHPLLARLGYASGAVRASVGVGTTQEEVDRLITALETYVTDGPTARYEIVDACWTVADDPRPLPEGSGLSGLIATAAAGFIAGAAGCGPVPEPQVSAARAGSLVDA